MGIGLVTWVVLAGAAQAGVLYSNDFSSGSTDWTPEAGVALSVVNDDGAGGIGGGNAMQIVQTTANTEAAVFFTKTRLAAAGDYIEFAYDFRYTGGDPTTEFKMFTGDDLDNDKSLTEADYFGFSLFAREGANSVGYSYDKPWVMGDIAENGFSTCSPAIYLTNTYSASIRITYLDSDTVNYLVKFDGITNLNWNVDTVAYDSVNYDFFTYDSFGTRSATAGDTMLIDNIVITTTDISEPPTLSLFTGSGL